MLHKNSQKKYNNFEKERESAIFAHKMTFSLILASSVKSGIRSYLYAFLLKGGVATSLKVLYLKKRIPLIRLLEYFCSVSTYRFAKMIGLFSFLYHATNRLMQYHRKSRPSKLNGAIAGAIAGLAVICESKQQRYEL